MRRSGRRMSIASRDAKARRGTLAVLHAHIWGVVIAGGAAVAWSLGQTTGSHEGASPGQETA